MCDMHAWIYTYIVAGLEGRFFSNGHKNLEINKLDTDTKTIKGNLRMLREPLHGSPKNSILFLNHILNITHIFKTY